MAIGVGAGDYAEYLPFDGGPVDGPGLFFIWSGEWLALQADNSWFERAGPTGVTGDMQYAQADTLDDMVILDIDQTSPATHRKLVSSDGGNTFTLADEDTFPVGIDFLNTLRFIYRDGMYRVLCFEAVGGDDEGLLGGEYASVDGITWTRTGRVPPHPWMTTNPTPPPDEIVGSVSNSDGWCATSLHAYYLMDTAPAGGGLAVLVDDESSGFQKASFFHLRSDPPFSISGGTFTITYNGDTTAPIAWNASTLDIAAAVRALSSWPDTGGTFFGQLSSDNLMISAPEPGPQTITVDDSLITGGVIDLDTTLGTDGVASYGVFDNIFASSNGFFGARNADVAMLLVGQAGADLIHKFINTASPVDVTPSFVLPDDEINQLLVSSDGDTWVGSIFINADGVNRLMVTHDQGANWALVGPLAGAPSGGFGPPTFGVPGVVVDPITPTTWYALFEDGFMSQVYRSTDNGDTWTAYGNPVFGGVLVPIGGPAI